MIIRTIKTLITLAILSTICLFSLNTNAQTRPTPITKDVTQIPIDTTKPFDVYFEYGSLSLGKDISNIAATAKIVNTIDPSKSPAFEFLMDDSSDETSHYDIFDGDPGREDNAPAPREAFPCSAPDLPRYKLPSSLFTKDSMSNYGLQTNKTNIASVATLTKGSTGCILFKVKLSPNAKVGDQASIQFDWDTLASTDFESNQRPQVIFQPLAVAPSASVAVSSQAVSQRPSQAVQSRVVSSATPAPITRTGGVGDNIALILGVGLLILIVFLITRKSMPKES
jgi:hypothetical protein